MPQCSLHHAELSNFFNLFKEYSMSNTYAIKTISTAAQAADNLQNRAVNIMQPNVTTTKETLKSALANTSPSVDSQIQAQLVISPKFVHTVSPVPVGSATGTFLTANKQQDLQQQAAKLLCNRLY
jgi:hypothetical protein